MALTKIGKEGVAGISNSSDATAITISSGEVVTLADDLIIKDSGTIGSASKTDAITIASSGLVQLTSTGIGAGSQVFQVIDDGATLFQLRAEDGNVSFPQSGAGIYLGVTAGNSANLLDDFEEGTWTPDIRNADNANSFSTEDGTYTKIGNRVCVTFRNDSGNTGGGGSVQIRNLPFSHDGHFSAVGLAAVNGGSLTNRQYNVTANSGTTFHLYNGGSIDSSTFSYVSGFAVYITNS
tara:strand:- start:634 stop:1344 length:711 start_codon:yes stop_codon:yes gene_type:complete